MKLDDQGAVLWERTYGSDGIERVYAIAEDHTGQLYATGTFRQRDDAPLDVYTIGVHGADGGQVWTDRFDQGRDDTGRGITIDGARFNVWLGQVSPEGELRHSLHHGSSQDDRGVHLLPYRRTAGTWSPCRL